LDELMALSIRELVGKLLDPARLEASFEMMGLDRQLVDDGTYFVIEHAGYTHPEMVRRGIGRRILELCEAAAAAEGFRSLELVATVAGEPLYAAYGFEILERIEVPTSHGVTVPCARMRKPITQSGPR